MADFIYAISTLFEGEKRDTSPARLQGYTKSCDTSNRPVGENASDNEIRLWVSSVESLGLAFDPEPRGRLRHWRVWLNTPSTESGLCIFALPWPFLINMQMTCGPEVGSSQSQSDPPCVQEMDGCQSSQDLMWHVGTIWEDSTIFNLLFWIVSFEHYLWESDWFYLFTKIWINWCHPSEIFMYTMTSITFRFELIQTCIHRIPSLISLCLPFKWCYFNHLLRLHNTCTHTWHYASKPPP